MPPFPERNRYPYDDFIGEMLGLNMREKPRLRSRAERPISPPRNTRASECRARPATLQPRTRGTARGGRAAGCFLRRLSKSVQTAAAESPQADRRSSTHKIGNATRSLEPDGPEPQRPRAPLSTHETDGHRAQMAEPHYRGRCALAIAAKPLRGPCGTPPTGL
jgi:hypothetical protein